jgi:hypothetical protein
VAAIRAALAAGATLDSLAAPYGGLQDSGLLGSGAGFVPMVGNEPRVVQKAFAMKPGDLTDTLQVGQGVVWMRLEEKTAGDASAFASSSAPLEAEMIKRKVDEWADERKKAVRIEILRPDLKGPRLPVAPSGPAAGRR